MTIKDYTLDATLDKVTVATKAGRIVFWAFGKGRLGAIPCTNKEDLTEINKLKERLAGAGFRGANSLTNEVKIKIEEILKIK